MSVAVCRGPIVPAFEAPTWLRPVEVAPYKQPEQEVVAVDERPAQVDIWNAIQADANAKKAAANKPYVHPLVRRSSSLMSQKSLEVCTESLGNETGSGEFTSSLDMACLFDSASAAVVDEPFFWQQQHDADREEVDEKWETKELAAVNYHCSAGRPRRAFPPPLPSMSRRDGPCIQMRPRREDGRLVVEAVAVRPRGYLNARRQGGRLRLSFVECCGGARGDGHQSSAAASKIVAEAPYFPAVAPREEEAAVEVEEDDEVEEDEEEVEVVDRGTVVEVKVSTQPQTAAKVHRSTLVINKFVGSTPVSVDPPRCHVDTATDSEEEEEEAACDDEAQSPRSTLRRVPSSTTTLAAAVAVASTGTDTNDDEECGGAHPSAAAEPKQPLLFTSRRGDKQDLLQSVRRCRQLRQKPLFILEQYCIATS